MKIQRPSVATFGRNRQGGGCQEQLFLVAPGHHVGAVDGQAERQPAGTQGAPGDGAGHAVDRHLGEAVRHEKFVQLGLLRDDRRQRLDRNDRSVAFEPLLAGDVVEAVVDADVEQLVGDDQLVGQAVLGLERRRGDDFVGTGRGDAPERVPGRDLDHAGGVVHLERRLGRGGGRGGGRRRGRGRGRRRGGDVGRWGFRGDRDVRGAAHGFDRYRFAAGAEEQATSDQPGCFGWHARPTTYKWPATTRTCFEAVHQP